MSTPEQHRHQSTVQVHDFVLIREAKSDDWPPVTMRAWFRGKVGRVTHLKPLGSTVRFQKVYLLIDGEPDWVLGPTTEHEDPHAQSSLWSIVS